MFYSYFVTTAFPLSFYLCKGQQEEKIFVYWHISPHQSFTLPDQMPDMTCLWTYLCGQIIHTTYQLNCSTTFSTKCSMKVACTSEVCGFESRRGRKFGLSSNLCTCVHLLLSMPPTSVHFIWNSKNWNTRLFQIFLFLFVFLSFHMLWILNMKTIWRCDNDRLLNAVEWSDTIFINTISCIFQIHIFHIWAKSNGSRWYFILHSATVVINLKGLEPPTSQPCWYCSLIILEYPP